MTYEEAVTAIPAGLYRHFKGNHYRVLSVARYSETMEPMVVYKALYGDGGVWIRPAEMWNEAVEKDGKTYQRFHPLSAKERVAFFERIYDELSSAAESDHPLSCELRGKCLFLEEYYTTGEWRNDYESDEAGAFPDDLKRGVLSQDGVYDLLERLHQV